MPEDNIRSRIIRELQGRIAGEGKKSIPFPGFGPETMAELYVSRTSLRSLHDDLAVDRWIRRKLKQPQLHSRFIPIKDIQNWRLNEATGNISHDSGRFFSITGVHVRHRMNQEELEWDQPIIDQPEIGIMGFLVKNISGVLHFCVRAKEEPGNINSVQLSPTVQATRSNYSRVHGGTPPPFIELFLDTPGEKLVYAKLQTEDGGRFLFKSNRNMIVRVQEDELQEIPDDFIWLTLRQIRGLLRRDNLVNSCARSVLACLL